MGKDLLILKPFLNLFYTHWERVFVLVVLHKRETIKSIWKERSLLTEVLSSNPTFGLNPLEKKSHNLILATVTLKAGYTGLILVLERARNRDHKIFLDFLTKRKSAILQIKGHRLDWIGKIRGERHKKSDIFHRKNFFKSWFLTSANTINFADKMHHDLPLGKCAISAERSDIKSPTFFTGKSLNFSKVGENGE